MEMILIIGIIVFLIWRGIRNYFRDLFKSG